MLQYIKANILKGTVMNMGKFDGWLICSDFDGTVYADKHLSDENCAAIRYFQSEGGLFTFASGRFSATFANFADYIKPNAPIVALGGSVIAEGDELLYCGGIDTKSAIRFGLELLTGKDGVDALLLYTTKDVIKVKREDHAAPEELSARLPERMPKMVTIVDAARSDELLAELGECARGSYDVTRSWPRGIEFTAFEDTKGRSVLKLKELLGARHLVCVGDYENDISMIRAADIGYAVGNAVPSLKAAADRITVDCREHAIAAIIRDIESEVGANGD